MARDLPKAAKRKGRQVAALPFRVSEGCLEILVMTSRDSGRIVIPKGWPMKKLRDADAAAREAYEEAGLVGKIKRRPIGRYPYWKRLPDCFQLVAVDVYPLRVERQLEDWPEKGDRKMAWLNAKDAALLIDEPTLGSLMRRFAGIKLKNAAKGERTATVKAA